jgi:hypothetical protein
MRHSPALTTAATTVAAVTAGLTAAVVLSRRAARRLPPTTTVPATTTHAPAPATDGVVLPFVRPVAAAPAIVEPTLPPRCGDSGGHTKSGAPCAARATRGGRCHHHRLAA